ncbi:MAG: SDR family NAD(P)-dependent oxidoreductase, partial [Clostridia bacterium]|nr:SDR family NAD(P)-dependent oxidoreductase [Clostridia bacterium]
MAKILISDRTHPLAEELARLLREEGHEVLLNPKEISSPEEIRELIREGGVPDLLILSEYSSLRETLTGGNADAIAREVERKLNSAFLAAKHAGAAMAERGEGGILILGSLAADKPTGAIPAYAMILGALQMMMKELAL